VRITFANEEEKKGGWILSPTFLKEVQGKIQDENEKLPLELIEVTILAYEDLPQSL
jgi:hypothetical protein